MRESKKPPWLRKKVPPFQDLIRVKSILSRADLHTVCEEARCPNIGECFSRGTATFLILGNICTRNCAFCAVQKGIPTPVDENEPQHLLEAVEKLRIKYVVITSVTRDDLPDGGASQFEKTVNLLHQNLTNISVEILIPDFQGSLQALNTVMNSFPEVLNH